MEENKLFECSDCGKSTNNERIIELSSGNNIVIHRCDECYEKSLSTYEWQNEQWREDDIVCPWCGSRFDDYYEMSDIVDSPYEEFDGVVKCPDCRNKFELEIEVKCNYTSRKPSDQFNYEQWKIEQEE